MIRTRDFILFLMAVAFLVLAIGFEVIQTVFVSPFDIGRNTPQFSGGEGDSPEAEIILVADTRSDRIAKWRKLMGDITAPAASETIIEEVATTTTEIDSVAKDPITCPNYREYAGLWSPSGLVITEREGVRIFHEAGVGTSTDGIGVVRIILPLREFPAATTSCLPSDVVGIALDGSLIRNSEYGAYGVFEEVTIVGYALDGFPIYGVSAKSTDSCGGVMTPTGYRYYLSTERVAVINCFAAAPVPL